MFKQIKDYRNELMRRGSTYYAIGRDIYDYGRDLIQERLNEKPLSQNLGRSADQKTQESVQDQTATEAQSQEENKKERKRKNMQKNFEVPEPDNAIEKGKQTSLAKSQ